MTRSLKSWVLVTVLLGLLSAACAPAATPQPAATPAPAATSQTAATAQPGATAVQPAPTAAQPAATQAPAGPKPKLTVWISTSFTPAADDLQKKYVMDWAAAKGVDVTIVQDSSTVLAPQLNAAIESKNLPDVMSWASPDWAPKLNRLGLALDVTDIVNTMNKQGGGLYESALRAVTANGKSFAIPTYSATEVFYVRKDLLDAKGLKAPETWEDVYTVAKALTEKGKVWGYGQQLGTPSYDAEISLLSMLASYGSSPYAADGKTPALNNEGTRKVIAMIKDAWDFGSVPHDAVTWDDSGNNKAYLTKAAAMVYNTGSIVAAMRKDDPDLLKNTIVTTIPKGAKGRILLGYIYGLIIPNTTKYPDLAKDLVLYMTAVDRQGKIVEAAGTNYMPLYKDLAKQPMWSDPVNATLMSELADNNAIGYPGPATEWALEAWRTHTITEMVDKVIVDNVPVDQAIKETEDKLVKIYQQFNK
jgi:multiple sugar transport system substrate-binding protein